MYRRWWSVSLVAAALPLALPAPVEAGSALPRSFSGVNTLVAHAAISANLEATRGEISAAALPVASRLPALVIHDLRVIEPEEFRLYDGSDRLDEGELRRMRFLLGDGKEAPIRTRTIQLVAKAAYHFNVTKVVVVSSLRKGARHGPHAKGAAIDFQLVGVPAARLASYLRKEPRVGVGIYTNPNTQFVHVDDREISYHWIDASPPGAHWRERMMKDATRDERDLRYAPEMDLPEALRAPTK